MSTTSKTTTTTTTNFTTMDSRHGFGRLGSRWPRQAWRGCRKSREDGSESRAVSRGWRRMARLCSASEKSFDYGRWSKWPARREHNPTEGQERYGLDLWFASGKSLWYGPYPSGKREETTAARECRRYCAFIESRESSIKPFWSSSARSTDFPTFRPTSIAPLIGFWASHFFASLSEKQHIWMRNSQKIIFKLNLTYLTWQKSFFARFMRFVLSVLNNQMM